MIREIVAVSGAALSVAIALGVTSMASADDSGMSKVMGAIDVAAGQHTGDVSTVNGSIHIGPNAVVGKANTVNGSVNVETHATTGELNAVNGSIEVHDGAHVNGNLHTVNGSLRIGNTADVTGDISNVNGGIHVSAAHIGGSIDTVSGNVDLGPNARIDGRVTIEKDQSWHFGFQKVPRVVVEPGTVVRGRLHFDREVVLYVSDHATIGPVEGATAIKFSGNQPPG